jgi:hypothetical protein
MTDATRVNFETLPPVKVYIPGPQAKRAGDALREIQQTATAALQAMRHSAESDHDPIALEVLAERLDAITRKVRRAERAHIAAWTAEVQARDMGMHTSEESTDEPSPEHSP